MAKRGYKLQEFVAHSGNVNCLRIGKKTCRQFLTGGDDHVVNLWSVGKPEPLTSLNGHSSPIESVAFDSAEVLAVAGASSGVIKLWDLEETKVIHNLTGHRSYCTAVEFHPFGEFLASGSMDTNLKIWDIRKKGCTHTYKGHSRGISTMKFTPDGRWVVSGGLDHVVKVWDLTAGKLLHDFKLHQGHIRSLEFHPFEFLLATGSADRTIKFWDLETFEMISSTKCETAGVRSMKFHPDGTRLFCALDGSLKVYSWEPAICHDSVDMGWSTIGDLCVHDGKLLGGAYYENSVGVWVVDMSVVQLYGGSIVPEQDGQSEEKVELQNIALKKSENHRRSTSDARSTSPDSESKDIKNRMPTSNARCTSPDSESKDIKNRMSASNARCTSPDSESKDIKNKTSASNARCTSPDTESTDIKNRMSASNARCASPDTESTDIKNRMSASNARCTSPDTESKDMKNRMSHSNARCTSPDTESKDMKNRMSHFNARSTSPDSESTDIKNIYVDSESPVSSKKVESLCSPKVMAPPDSNEIKSPASQKQGSRAVLHAKPNESATNKSFVVPIFVPRDNHDTKRDSISTARTNAGTLVRPATTRKPSNMKIDTETVSSFPDSGSFGNNAPMTLPRPANRRKASATKSDAETVSAAPVSGSFRNTANTFDSKRGPVQARKPTSTKPEVVTVSTPLEYSPSRAKETAMNAKKAHARRPPSTTKFSTETMPAVIESGPFGTVNTFDSKEDRNSKSRLMFDNNARDSSEEQDLSVKAVNGKMGKLSPLTKSNLENDAQNDARGVNPAKVVNGVAVVHGRTRNLVERFEKIEVCSNVEAHSPDTTQIGRSGEIASTAPPSLISAERLPTALNNEQPVAGREEDPALNDIHDVQILMQNHDALLSTFTSRLAKLQMIRLFWERNDVKGAINAMNKLPDHSVQSDVVSVLLERVDIITLDLFLCLLPVLLGLLDAKIERHTTVSLEMLLKLVAVFGQLVWSTVSAPPAVGVDLHAEQRLESCKECFIHLQSVQKILPTLIRRGGVLGRYALELNLLLLQQS